MPGDSEIQANLRARSAKLRAAKNWVNMPINNPRKFIIKPEKN
jgi:hypothetical protein